MAMVTHHDVHGFSGHRHHGILETIGHAFGQVRVWRTRVLERRELSRLDDHMLRDIGVDRSMVDEEVQKPFWHT